MITLIDRADGTPLSELSPEDFTILQEQLVLESDQDYDYYLTEGTLELLAGAGMSAEAVSALSTRMRQRGLDVGWEQSPGANDAAFSGSVVDANVQGLGGIRIDLLDGNSMLGWSYSRYDGTFSVFGPPNVDDLYLRFSGRGDLILRHVPVRAPGDQGQFELQTLQGVVATEAGTPVSGVNVLLSGWKHAAERDNSSWTDLGGSRSWGDTDDEGRFSIPVLLPEDHGALEIELELTALSGETLETVARTVEPGQGFNLGVLQTPEPTPPQAEESTLESASVE